MFEIGISSVLKITSGLCSFFFGFVTPGRIFKNIFCQFYHETLKWLSLDGLLSQSRNFFTDIWFTLKTEQLL